MPENEIVISIITATFNAESFLRHLARSIQSQKTPEIEWLVIDGGSKDKTVALLESGDIQPDYWISERDKGIYDAWNKGIRAARGKWITFIGADDRFTDGAINKLISAARMANPDTEIIASRLEFVDSAGRHLRFVGEPWNWNKFRWSRMSFAHPGMLHKKSLFERIGLYNTEFKICSDADILLRANLKNDVEFLDQIVVIMQAGGASFSSKAIFETHSIWKKHKTLPEVFNIARVTWLLLRYWRSKVCHWFKF